MGTYQPAANMAVMDRRCMVIEPEPQAQSLEIMLRIISHEDRGCRKGADQLESKLLSCSKSRPSLWPYSEY